MWGKSAREREFMPFAPHRSVAALTDRLACVLVALTSALAATSARAATDEPVAAVWKERQALFSYRGMLTAYPCGVLQNRIALILATVGARPDVEVTVVNCDFPDASTVAAGGIASPTRNPRGPAGAYSTGAIDGADAGWSQTASGSGSYRRAQPRQVADVRVRLSMPAAMTPELIAELETDRKRRELITRVTGDVRPLYDDPIPFMAQRQVVTLSRETVDLEPADCELLDQMSSTLLRELGIRVVRRGYTCDRSWRSRITPTLEVEALVAVGFTVSGPGGKAPAGGDVDPVSPEDTGAEQTRDDAMPKPD
jgi:hypothetical protein